MYGVEHKLIAILSSLVILVPLAMARSITGTFLSPASVYSASWFVFTFLPLVLIFKAPINPWTIAYIAATAFLVTLSALPFGWQRARQKNAHKLQASVSLTSPLLTAAIYVSVSASVVFSLALVLQNGFSLDRIFLELLATSGQYAAQRGNSGMEYGMLGVLSTFFTYLAPALGGLQAGKPKRGYVFALSILPSLLAMVTQSAKLLFLVALCLYVGGALIARLFANDLSAPRLKGGWKMILGGAIIVSFVLVSFVSRLGVTDIGGLSDVIDPLLYSISSYTLGQVYAFSDFFAFTIHDPSMAVFKDEYYSWGAYTFASIFDALGIGKEFPPGFYMETGSYATSFETNIFTLFRGVIYDFGVGGSLVFMFLFGLFAHFVAHRAMSKTNAWLACATYIAVIVFILMSYLISVFVARYIFLNATAVWCMLHINERVYKRSKHGVALLNPAGV